MENVAGLMEKMQLTEKEEQGLRVGRIKMGKSLVKDPQAVGKIFSDKLAWADAVESALGKVWCPIKGMGCKDVGGNHFLFTFYQASGKSIVVVDFDGSKTVEEMDFSLIPI